MASKEGKRLVLRDYQRECLDAVRSDWQDVNRTLIVLATATGKTIVFLALLDELLREGELGRACVIAHRRELIQQPIERAREFFPELARRMGVVMADEDDAGARVVVATVQTLNSAGRLERALEAGPFSHVVLDEAHHGTCESYVAVLDRLDGAKVLGCTATPIRTDGDGLRKVFQSCAYRFPIGEGIARGALVPFDALGIGLPVSLSGLRVTEDGWESESLGDVLRAANVLEIVHDKWRELAGDRLTIAFTASVAQAFDTAAYFRERGVRAAAVCGETPRAERDRTLRAFRAGEIQVVANCQVLIEGFDAPQASCIMMICPTRSDLAYVQKLGRALRTFPGKTDARILDFAPLDERDVVMAGDVLGKPRDVAKAEAQAERAGILGALSVNRQGLLTQVDPHELVIRVLDYLRRDRLAWALEGNLATAALSTEHMLAVVLPDLDRVARGEGARSEGGWGAGGERLLGLLRSTRLYLISKTGYSWRAETVGVFPAFEEAQVRAGRIASELADPTLARRGKRWRRLPAKPGQIAYLARLGVDHGDGLSRGVASQMISRAIAVRATMERARDEEMEALRA